MEVQNVSITESKSHHDSCEIIFATTSSSRKRRREGAWNKSHPDSSVGQESWVGERSSALSTFSSIATGEQVVSIGRHDDPMFTTRNGGLERDLYFLPADPPSALELPPDASAGSSS